ncbi:MAG: DUF7033 domain-containing protein [Bacteroidota bacterium]
MPTPEPTCLVFAEEVSPRLIYIVDVLWNQQARVTSDPSFFSLFQGDKIQYTNVLRWQGILHIQPHGLLAQSDIRSIHIQMDTWEDLPVFFSGTGDIPFDWFAASFYLISRYEEYLPFQQDAYGRYPASESLAYRKGFLDKPLIQHWTACIRKRFNLHSLGNLPAAPVIQTTYDVDELFQYLHLPASRQLKKALRQFLRGEFSLLKTQWRVLTARQKDPYDVWEWLWHSLLSSQQRPIFFFSGADKVSGNDRQLSVLHPAAKNILGACMKGGEIGWHPSWASGDQPEILQEEYARLQDVTGQSLRHSRFHYLRFRLPVSYRRLMELGVQHEYSMGYGTDQGFRASYADPFPWFDVERNEATALILHPFSYMDSTSLFQQGWEPSTAADYLQQLQEQQKGMVSSLQFVFHPHCLTQQAWREVHDTLLKLQYITPPPHR